MVLSFENPSVRKAMKHERLSSSNIDNIKMTC